MPIEYTVDSSHNVLVVKASDEISILDRASLVQQLLSDTTLPAAIPLLIDVSTMTNVPAIGEISTMAFLVEQLSKRFGARIAYFVVAPGMVTPYHLVALSVHGRAEVRTFTTKVEALCWLTGQLATSADCC